MKKRHGISGEEGKVMFHRELKLNFGVLEHAADALDHYGQMLTRLTEVLHILNDAMKGGEGEAHEALMQTTGKTLDMILGELSAVTDTREILRAYIRDMTAVISPDIWGQQMVVDRNDIRANMLTMEEKLLHLANIGYHARVSSWDICTIAPDQKTRKAEERYYKRVETVREEIIPGYFRRLCGMMEEMEQIYEEKIVRYENIDDEYLWIADHNYQKHQESCDVLRNAGEAAVDTFGDIIVGAAKGIWDMAVGAIEPGGGAAYTAVAGAACAFCKKAGIKEPEWAGEHIESIKKSGEAILRDPMLLVEGMAQGATDAIEQKGIAYCAGYIIGPIIATKGIAEGSIKLREAWSAKQARKALAAEEAAMKGADDLATAADDAGRAVGGTSLSDTLTAAQKSRLKALDNTIECNLKEMDFSGTLRDLQGNPVPNPQGGYYDHLTEMKQSYTSLTKIRRGLEGSLNNPSLSINDRKILQEGLNKANAYIQRIEELFKPFGGIN